MSTKADDLVRELRESRQMLRLVLDTIPARVFWKDRESRYLGCNRPFATDGGLPEPEAIVGRTDFELGWAEQAELYRADDRHVIETGQAKLGYEEPQTTPEGGRIWLRTSKVPLRDADGVVRGVLGTYEDITDRKLVEQAVRESEAAYRTLAQNLPGIVYRMPLPAPARIELFNDVLEQLTGYATEELGPSNGCPLQPLVVPEDQPSVCAVVAAAVASAAPYEVAYRLRTKDAGERYVVERGRPVRGKSGAVHHVDGVVFDQTDRRAGELERQRLQAQLQQTQKLESLGMLAGGIAHDFNNLLVAILGHADLVLRDLPPGSPGRGGLLAIERTSRRAAELCRQMLAYSGRGRFEIRRFDLRALVREMAEMLRVSVSKKAVLSLRLPDELPAIEGDASQIRQVVLNLILNASEALAGAPGTIELRVGARRCDRTWFAQSWLADSLPEGEYVELEVSDDGCGMDPATLERVFEPFFTTKFTGRGLGLAAVLGIVRGHRGAVRVQSEVDHGTRFTVVLPALAASVSPAEGVEAPISAKPPGWTGQPLVLLVDDEDIVRSLGEAMLQRLGLRVLLAADGPSAIELYRQRSSEVACVLLDLTMPHMDGVETMRELRRICPTVRVILSSGYSEEDVGSRLGEGEPVAFLQKPYDLCLMREKLLRALGAGAVTEGAAEPGARPSQ